MARKRLLSKNLKKIPGVAVFPFGLKLTDQFAKRHAGKHILLADLDSQIMVAMSASDGALIRFAKENHLLDLCHDIVRKSGEHFLF